MTIDRNLAKAVADELEAAANDVFARHGLKKAKMSVSYGQNVRITLTAVDPDAEIPAYILSTFGLDEDVKPGLLFTSGGKTFRFTGVATNRPKFPINGEDVATGKSYKHTTAVVGRINDAARAAANG